MTQHATEVTLLTQADCADGDHAEAEARDYHRGGPVHCYEGVLSLVFQQPRRG